MELKPLKNISIYKRNKLLIVPYGIETWKENLSIYFLFYF